MFCVHFQRISTHTVSHNRYKYNPYITRSAIKKYQIRESYSLLFLTNARNHYFLSLLRRKRNVVSF